MRPKKTASTATHTSPSQGFQNQRTQLAISAATISTVAISGRHCCSYG